MVKRGYTRAFTPRTDTPVRYLLDDVPPTLWHAARVKARKDGKSMRGLLLELLQQYLAEPQP